MDLKEIGEALSYWVRPQTFPLAVRMCQSDGEIPKNARIPTRDLKVQVTLCQGVSMARRYGWTLAIGRDDESCPTALVGLGFLPAKKAWLDGSFDESISPGSGQRSARVHQAQPRLEYGKYTYILMAPLHTATFEPQLILVYGTPAQMMRLVQGRADNEGLTLTSNTSGGGGCTRYIAEALLSDECQLCLPGNGDRVMGLTQDHEMAFSMPLSKVETTIKGLEETHRDRQLRYPIPSYLRYEAQLPPSYYLTRDFLMQPD